METISFTGWADGYYMEIRYWEIWNEPESRAMWTGTFEEFTDFYITASRYLKAQFPALKFGGYGSIGFYPLTRHDDCFAGEPYISLIAKIRYFLTEAKKNGAPVDFFSWHLYSEDVEEYVIYAQEARRVLEECGFPEAESVLDEWNTGELKAMQKMRGASLMAAALKGFMRCRHLENSMGWEIVWIRTVRKGFTPVLPEAGMRVCCW